MIERIIETEADRIDAARFIQNRAVPFTLRFYEGKKRSLKQNDLSWKWYSEAAEQLGEYSVDDYHAICKLELGVPIMREDDDFRAAYDEVLRPLSYEKKIKAMGSTLNFPVTSLMTTKQKSRYLDAVFSRFHGQGVKLTEPEQ